MNWIFYAVPVVAMIGGIVVPLACVGNWLKKFELSALEWDR